jgi:hypothetical protein
MPLFARAAARVSSRALRSQTAWYNRSSDRLAVEIRQMSLEVEKARAAAVDSNNTTFSSSSIPPTPEEIFVNKLKEPRSIPAEEKHQTPNPQTGLPTLPRRKLRALMALYHESANFITPETLDQHIEKEFARKPNIPNYLRQKDLSEEARRRRFTPELTTTRFIQDNAVSTGVSSERKSRNTRLAGALWGVDEHNNPTLEAVEEAKELGLLPSKKDT